MKEKRTDGGRNRQGEAYLRFLDCRDDGIKLQIIGSSQKFISWKQNYSVALICASGETQSVNILVWDINRFIMRQFYIRVYSFYLAFCYIGDSTQVKNNWEVYMTDKCITQTVISYVSGRKVCLKLRSGCPNIVKVRRSRG